MERQGLQRRTKSHSAINPPHAVSLRIAQNFNSARRAPIRKFTSPHSPCLHRKTTWTVIEQGAMIKGPAWIGEGCQIRSGCYIRENVIVGSGCVLGNSCEFKNSIIFDEAQIPHFNYVGDSIIGHRSHLGAGVILSNVRLDRGEISVATAEGTTRTGLKKFGAIIGDHAEIGCNSVLNPGSLIGRRSIVYPGTQWQGVAPENSIIKTSQSHQILARRD